MQHLDRQLLLWFNDQGNDFIDTLVIVCTSWWTWLPLYAALVFMLWRMPMPRKAVVAVVIAAAVSVAVAAMLDEWLVKPGVQRLRPCNDPSLQGLVSIVRHYRNSSYSFFSGHAANTCTLATCLSVIVRKRAFACAMAAWVLLNCYTRLYLAQHYLTDILAGLLVGGAIGYTAATLVRRHFALVRRRFALK